MTTTETPSFSTQLGIRLRQCREAMQLTPEEVVVQLSPYTARNKLTLKNMARTFSSWEKGEAMPSLTSITDLGGILGVPPEYLAFGINGSEPVSSIAVPKTMFTGRNESKNCGVLHTDKCFVEAIISDWPEADVRIWIQDDTYERRYPYADRTFINAAVRQVTVPGRYIYWNGICAAAADIRIHPSPIGRPLLQSSAFLIPMELEAIPILGQVIARMRAL